MPLMRSGRDPGQWETGIFAGLQFEHFDRGPSDHVRVLRRPKKTHPAPLPSRRLSSASRTSSLTLLAPPSAG